MWIDPDHRNKGIGSKLLKRFVRKYHHRFSLVVCAYPIALETESYSTFAKAERKLIRWYKVHGFKQLDKGYNWLYIGRRTNGQS